MRRTLGWLIGLFAAALFVSSIVNAVVSWRTFRMVRERDPGEVTWAEVETTTPDGALVKVHVEAPGASGLVIGTMLREQQEQIVAGLAGAARAK